MTAPIPSGAATNHDRIPDAVFDAAMIAAFPALPDGMGLDEAARRIAAALNATRPLVERDLRTRLADSLDRFADEHYPEDVFTPGSTQPDGVAGNAMRHAYHTAARMIRDGWPDNEEN